MKTATLLPAVRSRVGDWSFYVSTMTFVEVAALIKAPDEVHERKNLAEWIQREAIDTHAAAIASYITTTPQRFLGSIIVGLYGGTPDWSPLEVRFPDSDEITEAQRARVEGTLGLLHLFGSEKLFAIDGQHRVAGIKLALQDVKGDNPLINDCVSAIFVAHDPSSDAGKARTRRLFTTVNKRARAIAKTQTIALDEDNGFAIVTRRLIDTHALFSDEGKRVLYESTGSIPSKDVKSLTSVVGLYEIVKDLYGGKASFDQGRPDDASLDAHLELCKNFFNELLDKVPEYREVFEAGSAQPGEFRTATKNHLLFRPAGQRAFARAIQLLRSRQVPLSDAVSILLGAEMNLLDQQWHHILWNPIAKTMINGTLVVAEAQILRLAGQKLRSASSGKKLDTLLAASANAAPTV